MQTLPLTNVQPPEKPDHREDGSLDVVSVFRTVQGEGPHVGTPAIFVRLAGCNLQCSCCDTDYTTGKQRYSIKELVGKVWEARGTDKINWVVLTGGEPLRQNIRSFVKTLVENRLFVEVETNGTYAPDGLNWFHSIVCSPKTPTIHKYLEGWITAYKYVVAAGQTDPNDGLPLSILGTPCYVARPKYPRPIFIQPQDDQDPAVHRDHNTDAGPAGAFGPGAGVRQAVQ